MTQFILKVLIATKNHVVAPPNQNSNIYTNLFPNLTKYVEIQEFFFVMDHNTLNDHYKCYIYTNGLVGKLISQDTYSSSCVVY